MAPCYGLGTVGPGPPRQSGTPVLPKSCRNKTRSPAKGPRRAATSPPERRYPCNPQSISHLHIKGDILVGRQAATVRSRHLDITSTPEAEYCRHHRLQKLRQQPHDPPTGCRRRHTTDTKSKYAHPETRDATPETQPDHVSWRRNSCVVCPEVRRASQESCERRTPLLAEDVSIHSRLRI
jgi:hypothetical protein